VSELQRRHFASFIYGFAMPHLVSFSQEVLGGAAIVCRVPQLVRVVNPAYLLHRVLSRYPALRTPLRRLGSRCITRQDGISRKIAALCLTEVTSFDDRFNSLWDEVASKLPIAIVRDRQYLSWRYPTSRYTILCSDDGPTIHGYVVVRITTWNGWRVGCIADHLADSMASARRLVQGALTYLQSQGVDLIRCWMMEHIPYQRLFRRFGFARRPSPYTLIVRSHAATVDQQFLQVPSNWFIAWGDSDGV
jgi:hypothetical protein